VSRSSRIPTCIYCGQHADSKEHIFATRFIDVLREDSRGLRMPLILYITSTEGGRPRRIGGKRIKRGGRQRSYTLEYTTRVCAACNSGWMNEVDTGAFPLVAEMIRGNPIQLDQSAQTAVGAWIAKVAVTARAAPHDPLPIEPEWTDWLYQHRSAPPRWHIWIGRYVGPRPWWYNPHDVRAELGEGSAPAPPGFVGQHGVLATLIIGQLIWQIFGMGGPAARFAGIDADERTLPAIWPPRPSPVSWPPTGHVDDVGLDLWANRLLQNPSRLT